MNPLNKILIANRGEIAVRVLRTAKAMGYRTVAVYSDVDAEALHVQLADQAVYLGPAPAAESYLVSEKLIAAAERSGADAIHPGYGFLSENADFARACGQAGITFVGPSPEAIELMGSKRLSKLAMLEAGIPCIPGYLDSEQSDARLMAEAEKIGFPLMVKASAGGGGRGMRRVGRVEEFEESVAHARSEAEKAFGSGELILEKALFEPRHIEVQVFADNHGNVVYLGERDCSIQRRHQKVVEEAPSPFVDRKLRRLMGESAVNVAAACGYRGAGTVEFLVDEERRFYFLEMNTRLQVEHPVTELISGQDLVAWQLEIAAGEPLPLSQKEIALTGHAIEARLYAEDPRNQFLPQSGQIIRWELPESEGVRIDHGITVGQQVTPHYDPLLAKIIAFGKSREEARRRLARAVDETRLLGVKSNKQFLAGLLRKRAFSSGDITTAFVDKVFGDDASLQPEAPDIRELAVATYLFCLRSNPEGVGKTDMIGWRNGAMIPLYRELQSESRRHELTLRLKPGRGRVRFTTDCGGESLTLDILSVDERQCIYAEEGLRQSCDYAYDGERLFIDLGNGNREFADLTHQPRATRASAGGSEILASMDGMIIDVRVAEGESIERGQTVVVLEAMKMEHQLKAGISGVVESVKTSIGEQVSSRQVLVEIKPQGAGG